jgi:archaellum component FlaC
MSEGIDRDWLEARFKALEDKFEAIMDRVVDITGPIKADIERARTNINDLFTLLREQGAEIAILKSDKTDKQVNTGTIVAVVVAVAATALGVIGLL